MRSSSDKRGSGKRQNFSPQEDLINKKMAQAYQAHRGYPYLPNGKELDAPWNLTQLEVRSVA